MILTIFFLKANLMSNILTRRILTRKIESFIKKTAIYYQIYNYLLKKKIEVIKEIKISMYGLKVTSVWDTLYSTD